MNKTFLSVPLLVALCITASAKTADSTDAKTQAKDIPICGLPLAKESQADAQDKASTKQLPRMLVYNGSLYVDTGEVSTVKRTCGTMDGTVTKTVAGNKIPTKELQSNFGKGYGFQAGSRKNRIDVRIKDTWHIFAYNENNLDGLSMEAVRSSTSAAILEITNDTGKEIIFGDDFKLERKNAKTGEWSSVAYKICNFGFNSIAYPVAPNTKTKYKVNWKWLYGNLKPGTYRIVKSFLDCTDAGDNAEYTLTAIFRIKKKE